MRNRLFAFAFPIILLYMLSSCASNIGTIDSVYSFHGENDTLAVNNGLIVLAGDEVKFVGGNMTFKPAGLAEIARKSTEFYYTKGGNKVVLLANKDTNLSSGSANVSVDLGSMTEKSSFTKDELTSLEQTLHFSITGSDQNEEDFIYDLSLEIKKVY